MVAIKDRIETYRRLIRNIMIRFHQQNRHLTTRQAQRLALYRAELRELRRMEQIYGPNAQVHTFECPKHSWFARNSENGLFD